MLEGVFVHRYDSTAGRRQDAIAQAQQSQSA